MIHIYTFNLQFCKKTIMSQKDQNTFLESINANQKPRCRICLEEEEPLQHLSCHCRGDLSLVHENCYSKWI